VNAIRQFWNDEGGQSLVEYTILTAYLALFMVAFFKDAGILLKGAWTTANSQLTAANTSAS
jgi:Flp pilus assembly pilin Flp